MIRINISFNQYLELEKLGMGVFNPVQDFMKKKEFDSVVNKMIYKKKIFPLPIILDLKEKINLKKVKKIQLIYDSKLVGEIKNPEIYTCNKKNCCKKNIWNFKFKTSWCKRFYIKGKMVYWRQNNIKKKIKNDLSKYEIFPSKVKSIIQKRKFKTIVGFQTRNVPHKAHEYLIRNSLENFDAILIQPLIGKKKLEIMRQIVL